MRSLSGETTTAYAVLPVIRSAVTWALMATSVGLPGEIPPKYWTPCTLTWMGGPGLGPHPPQLGPIRLDVEHHPGMGRHALWPVGHELFQQLLALLLELLQVCVDALPSHRERHAGPVNVFHLASPLASFGGAFRAVLRPLWWECYSSGVPRFTIDSVLGSVCTAECGFQVPTQPPREPSQPANEAPNQTPTPAAAEVEFVICPFVRDRPVGKSGGMVVSILLRISGQGSRNLNQEGFENSRGFLMQRNGIKLNRLVLQSQMIKGMVERS